jgi:hypothetical protein
MSEMAPEMPIPDGSEYDPSKSFFSQAFRLLPGTAALQPEVADMLDTIAKIEVIEAEELRH